MSPRAISVPGNNHGIIIPYSYTIVILCLSLCTIREAIRVRITTSMAADREYIILMANGRNASVDVKIVK
ncbi:hypothetical protein D3C75_1283670 [compost metagenome]